MSRTKVKQNLIDASFGNVLEYFSYIPDGRTITTTQGDITVSNQTTYTDSTNSIQDTGGSAITYTPPVGTKYVEYTYKGSFTALDYNPILHYRIQLGGTDITHSYQSFNPDDGGQGDFQIIVKAVILITGSGSDDIANGKVDTWTSGKVLRAAFRSYNNSQRGRTNARYTFDGLSAVNYTPGLHTIIAYS